MNISELARKLRVNSEELKAKLPELGFDIGRRAIKIDDNLANKIIYAWKEYQFRKQQEQEYLKTKSRAEEIANSDRGEIALPPAMSVKEFALILHLPVTEVIKQLMKSGVMASLNQRIDYDTAAIVASDLGFKVAEGVADEKVEMEKEERYQEIMKKETDMQPRPPVIVVMGHVDHGKTKLLDAIRMTDVVSGEAGGITQHIGAYQIKKRNRLITFIDTPGHEAFTAMRSRGAKVADVAILVVAANDSVMPQTIEAQKIAEAVKIPIVVAINKIDLPEANIEKVKQDLAQHNLQCEEWGGKTICVPISAKQNLHIDDLLDQVLLVADMEAEKIVANPNGEFIGSVIEAHVDKGKGPVATVLVKNGTLIAGSKVVVDGQYYGKIRMMYDYKGQEIDKALPSTPVQIIGLKVAPKVGDMLEVTDEKIKKVSSYKLGHRDEKYASVDSDEDESSELTKINIVLRSDVLGSQEAIMESLEKLNNDILKIKFVAKGLGNITDNDVLTAESTGAMLLGFNVRPNTAAESLAQEKGIEIKTFRIIYELIDAVKLKINELIKPEIVREELGKVEVLKVFKKIDNGLILGGRVISGRVTANCEAGVLRADQFVEKGKIKSLQIGKESVTDVVKGQEFGITFMGPQLVAEGDILDVYLEKEVRRKI